ncbi:hypothetical protein Tco_0303373 [Tanacetum coccineum]
MRNARRGTASRVFTSRFRPPSRLVVAAREAKTPPTVWFSRRRLAFSPMAQATSHRTLCSKNKNHGNQGGNGNALAKVYVVGNAGTNPDSFVSTVAFEVSNDRKTYDI